MSAPSLYARFGTCFERPCREALPLICASGGGVAGCEVGEYWSPRTRIGVVGLRDDSRADAGEHKWGTVRSPARRNVAAASILPLCFPRAGNV